MSVRRLTEGDFPTIYPHTIHTQVISTNGIAQESGTSGISFTPKMNLGGDLSILSGVTTNFKVTTAGIITNLPSYSNSITSNARALSMDDGGVVGYAGASTREVKMNIDYNYDPSFIYALKPCKFQYRKRIDGKLTSIPESDLRFGLIAEDAEQVCEDICAYNGDKLFGIDYDKLVTPLVKCVQDLRKRIVLLEGDNVALKQKLGVQ